MQLKPEQQAGDGHCLPPTARTPGPLSIPRKCYSLFPIAGTMFRSLRFRMHPKHPTQSVEVRSLTIQEVRIVSDLRIMHAKVDELYQLVAALKSRHNELDVVKYADQPILTEDIHKVDEIYLWFVKLKETSIEQRS
jgi:hypothetical protein